MPDTVPTLPLPLLLLVHLQILEYPHRNEPEYDHQLFDAAVRGLRDRTKTMEDVCYFLVGKLERKDAKVVLPTYPCLQPSDKTAFRTSLAKYLDGLRNQAVYPSSTVHNKNVVADKGKINPNVKETVAWWWKDVVVRKSLLEECAGERFERLLVALSTHSLLRNASGFDLNVSETGTMLRTQPHNYISALATYQSTRRAWERSASLLLQRQNGFLQLRDQLANEGTTSTYDTLSSDRLLALADAKLQDLLKTHWKGSGSRHALDTLRDLAGLKLAESAFLDLAGIQPKEGDDKFPSIMPPPLPIAAAHHPSNLRKLRLPILLSATALKSKTQLASSSRPAPYPVTGLSNFLAKEESMGCSLQDALSRVRRVGQELSGKVRELQEKQKSYRTGKFSMDVALWEEDERLAIKFTTVPTPDLLSAFSLHTPPSENMLESEIDAIRESLPTFPPIPGPQHQHSPAPGQAQSSNYITLQETPRQVRTSTPPPSVKPRSAYVRKVFAGQSVALQGGNGVGKDRRASRRMSAVKDRRVSSRGRKSIRFSLALMSRPSLFGDEVEHLDDGEDEVNRILDAVLDESTCSSIEGPITPMPRTPVTVNRIITSGSTIKRSTTKNTPRESFKIHERKSLLPLPDEWTDDDDDDELGSEETGYEGNSVTLRDILLKAGDVTQFDLLDDDPQLVDESFGWD